MKRRIRTGIQLTASVLAILTSWLETEAWAYTSTLVKEGTTVQGTVTITDHAPAPQEFELRRFPDHDILQQAL